MEGLTPSENRVSETRFSLLVNRVSETRVVDDLRGIHVHVASTWNSSLKDSSSTCTPRGLHVAFLPTQIKQTEPQRLGLQAQNRVFEARDVKKKNYFQNWTY